MAFDHAGHQELALGIDALGAVGGDVLRLRCDGGDAFAIDQNLARKRSGAGAVPYPGILDQQPHRYSLPIGANHNATDGPGPSSRALARDLVYTGACASSHWR